MDSISNPGIVVLLAVLGIDLVVRLGLLIYIPRNRKPTAATAWLLLIFILPITGTILFFILGSTKLSRSRMAKQKVINDAFRKLAESEDHQAEGQIDQQHLSSVALAKSLTNLPVTTGNSVEVLIDYDKIISDMSRKISRAKNFVFVEFYTLALDDTTEQFFTALESAIKNGARVYVLFDAYGSRKYKNYRLMKSRMSKSGINWAKILPFSFSLKSYNRPDLRNHRKIVVVDGEVAYTGSLNMIDKTYHRKDAISYLELVVRTTGPNVRDQAAVFIGDWYSETNESLQHFLSDNYSRPDGQISLQVIPSGSAYEYSNNLLFLNSLLNSARDTVYITNPYLVPDQSLLITLISAAKRGVKVSILNSEAIDQWMVGNAQRSYYDELIKAGVKIYLYKKPQLVHEKFLVVDGSVALVGSSNLDIRSFELNMECTVVIYDKICAEKLSGHHKQLLVYTRQLQYGKWRKRSMKNLLLESVARLTSALQ